jgi:hypothetical protein
MNAKQKKNKVNASEICETDQDQNTTTNLSITETGMIKDLEEDILNPRYSSYFHEQEDMMKYAEVFGRVGYVSP